MLPAGRSGGHVADEWDTYFAPSSRTTRLPLEPPARVSVPSAPALRSISAREPLDLRGDVLAGRQQPGDVGA
jgi:hypothetical protein